MDCLDSHGFFYFSVKKIPKTSTIDYLLEVHEANPDDDSLTVFCLDVSGSMCVSQPVPKDFKFKLPQASNEFSELPAELLAELGVNLDEIRQAQNNEISRLQAVQLAVESQLESMIKSFPKRKVALVTFNDQVTIFGDGSGVPVNVCGDKLYQFDVLLEEGKKILVEESIEKSKERLGDKILSLKESGSTALGPGLLVSIGIASNRPASKVIILTDGLANVGVGEFERASLDEASSFYSRVAELAQAAGVSVSVTSIKGENCRMEFLGEVAQATGGEVSSVDPLNLEGNFNSILKNPIIATQVQLRLLLHRYLYLTGPLLEELLGHRVKEHLNSATKLIGNVTSDTELAVQFAVSSDVPEEISEVPFQAQIHFTALNGNRYVRIITVTQSISGDLQEIAEDVDIAVYSAVVGQVNAALAQQGEYSKALRNAKANRQFLQNAAHTEQQQELLSVYDQELSNIDRILGAQQCADARVGGHSGYQSRSFHKNNRLDDTAVELYQLRSANKAACSIM